MNVTVATLSPQREGCEWGRWGGGSDRTKVKRVGKDIRRREEGGRECSAGVER